MALNPWEYAARTGNEHAHQVALFMWCNMAAKFGSAIADDKRSYSEPGFAMREFEAIKAQPGHEERHYWLPIKALIWLHAIKNQGHGDAIRGAKSAAEGVKAGVPDMFLPVPMIKPHGEPIFEGGIRNLSFPALYTGLYIELKRPDSVGKSKGKTSADQDVWAEHLKTAGYAVEVCFGWKAARDCILKYLGIGSGF